MPTVRTRAPAAALSIRVLLGLGIATAVLLMHGMVSASGCAGGMPMPATTPTHAAMTAMAGPLQVPAPVNPLWTAPRGGGGETCVSLPASRGWVGALILLLIVAGAGQS